MTKVYDEDYFRQWYADADETAARAELARKVALAVHMAEYYLGHEIENVLDIGCGKALWREPLLQLRPDVCYQGLDSSEYVVSEYGEQCNIGLATFGQLEHLRFDARFDLIVCADVLHYVGARELRRGLPGLVDNLEGVAFLEVFTSVDLVSGDKAGFLRRAPAWYRARFIEAGLTACGSHGYLGPRLMRSTAALEIAAY